MGAKVVMVAISAAYHIGRPAPMRVRAGLELPRVGEIEVVGHEETAFSLRGGRYVLVAPTTKLLVAHGVDVVAERGQPRRR